MLPPSSLAPKASSPKREITNPEVEDDDEDEDEEEDELEDELELDDELEEELEDDELLEVEDEVEDDVDEEVELLLELALGSRLMCSSQLAEPQRPISKLRAINLLKRVGALVPKTRKNLLKNLDDARVSIQ